MMINNAKYYEKCISFLDQQYSMTLAAY